MQTSQKFAQERKTALRVVAGLLLVLLLLPLMPVPGFSQLSSYLALHTLLESIAIVVASAVFIIGWHAYRGRASYRTVALACLFLGVAVLDFSHMLSFDGMPDYVTPSGPDKAIIFWLAARTFAACGLLCAAMLSTRVAPGATRYTLLLLVAAMLVVLHIWVLYFPALVPASFDPVTGLSNFKLVSETVLVLLYGSAAFLLWRRSENTRSTDALALAMAAALMMMSEFLFTRYSSFYDGYNVAGHIYKVIAYIYLYRALVIRGISEPYERLSALNSRLQATLDAMPDMMFEVDSTGNVVAYHSSPALGELLVPPEEFIGKNLRDFMTPQSMVTIDQAFEDIRSKGRTTGRTYCIERDDECRWYDISGAQAKDEETDGHYLMLIRDVTEQHKMEAELRIAATAFSSQEGIMITDASLHILKVNRAFETTTGFSQEEVLGHTPAILQSGRHGADFYRAMWQSINETGGWRGEIWNRRRNGEVYPQSLTITAVRNAAGEVVNYVGDFIDISAIKNAEEKISRLSWFDTLTGLVNRLRFIEILELSVSRRESYDQHSALLMVDLDDFKTINDTLGHEAGDQLLIDVAQRLQRAVRHQDTVARYGGDEFVVLLAELGESSEQAATIAQVVAQTLLTTLEDRYQLKGGAHYSSCSIGATFFKSGTDTTELLKQVDIALFQAKNKGRNIISFFDPAWQAAVSERAQLLADLRQAIGAHQFELYYQPQLDVDGGVIGAEALVRWNHPVRGVISPGEFIPLAEQNGLILALSHEILAMGLDQLQQWKNLPHCEMLKLSINLVPEQFYETGFAQELETGLRKRMVEPDLLMLEFTESTLMDNLTVARENMERLSQFGVHFALDDFGTGYSSLTYLSELPLDMLKIDQSFVRNIGVKDKDAAIVRTIIDMAYTLNMTVLAEGVETDAQRRFLLSHGCTQYQGYLFGRPVPAARFEEDRLAEAQAESSGA